MWMDGKSIVCVYVLVVSMHVCLHVYCMYMCVCMCVRVYLRVCACKRERKRKRECVHLCVCECVIKTSDFFFFYTQIIPLSQLVRVGFDHPDNQREEISLGLNPNWHPWWFFSKLKMWECSTINFISALKSKHNKASLLYNLPTSWRRKNHNLQAENTHICQKGKCIFLFLLFLWLLTFY